MDLSTLLERQIADILTPPQRPAMSREKVIPPPLQARALFWVPLLGLGAWALAVLALYAVARWTGWWAR